MVTSPRMCASGKTLECKGREWYYQGPVRAGTVSVTAKWLSARGSFILWEHWKCLETFFVVKMLGRGDR